MGGYSVNSHFSCGDIWIEITKKKQEHSIPSWEHGTCLWIPSKNRAGHDRYGLMRKPVMGDLVLHFYKSNWDDGAFETRLCGSSIIDTPYKEISIGPPSKGQWSNSKTYYKIILANYEQFINPISISSIIKNYGTEIRHELVECKPSYYPFSTYGESVRLVQGIYLAKCTSRLYRLLKNALKIQEASKVSIIKDVDIYDLNMEYAETMRVTREKYFFTRNKKLVNDAKAHYGYSCCICGFNFEKKYGELGKGYIECHHNNPLSERPESEWSEELITKLEGVKVLCSNCHRMIHSKRPALKIEQLVDAIKQL